VFRVAPLVLGLVLGVCALLTACGSSAPRAQGPKAVLASIVSAGLAQKSVRWVQSGYGENQGIWSWTADVDTNSGTERGAQSRRGMVEIRLVQNTAFVRGSFWQLMRMAGLSEHEARRFAGRWISIPRGDRQYAQIADGLTLASTIHDFACGPWPGAKLTVIRRKPQAKRSLGLRWRDSEGEECRLHARASDPPLPVSSVWGGLGNASSLHLSKWNEPVHVEAPTRSTPIATVRRS